MQRIIDLKDFKLGSFEIILDDPSGDSFLENPHAPSKDPNMTVVHYKRNKEQNELLGLDVKTIIYSQKNLHLFCAIFMFSFIDFKDEAEQKAVAEEEVDLKNEVVQFHSNCPNCNAVCDTNMKLTGLS